MESMIPTLLPEPWETQFLTFFLVFVRVSAVVISMPVIGGEMISRPIRAGIAFWLTVALTAPLIGLPSGDGNSLIPLVQNDFLNVFDFAIAVITEFMIGFALGFIAQVIVQTIALAGEIIGQQAGFSAASVFDPVTGQDTFLMAQINSLFGTMIFLVIGGPEMVLVTMAESFRLLPAGEGVSLAAFSAASYDVLLLSESQQQALGSMMYNVAIRIAAPLIGAMFLVSLSEAFLARTAPQLNILAVGFAIRIGMSLLVMFSSIAVTTMTFKNFILTYDAIAIAFMEKILTFIG